MTVARERWLAFLEEAVGFLALAAVADARPGGPDRWTTFAWLAGAYIAGLCAASVALERRLPFGRSRIAVGVDAPEGIDGGDGRGGGGTAGLELLGGALAFVALTLAFDRSALAPSDQWLGLAIVAAAAWTMGHGIAGAVSLLGLARRTAHATDVVHRTTAI